MNKLINIAKDLGKRSTDAEKLLWKYLRTKQLEGFKFRRQQQIDNYIVDFVCFKNRMVIELDGFKILRFWNNEVLQNIKGVLEMIRESCLFHPPLTPPVKGGKEEKRRIPLLIKAFLLIIVALSTPPLPASATFTLNIDQTYIDFGIIQPGESVWDIPYNGVLVSCTSDQGNAWKLMINNTNVFTNINNNAYQIANQNFKWYGVSSSGVGLLTKDEVEFSTGRQTVYSALVNEAVPDKTVDVHVKFRLNVPDNAWAGDYESNLVFTMTE